MPNRPPERQVAVQLDGRSIRLSGRHAAYLDGLDGADLSADPLITLARTTLSGGIYLDVGANIGATAIPVALARPDLRAVAFEPVPDNADFLERNAAGNDVRNLEIVRSAVGASDEMVTIDENGPWSRVGMPGLDARCITLDGWAAELLNGAPVGLIKIDAEGSEPRVLAGAASILRRDRPTLFMELNSFGLMLQGFNPLAFAAHLLERFEIEVTGLRSSDPASLIHDNLFCQGSVSNLVMRPRPGYSAPTDLAFTGASQALAEELRSMRASRSWRWTAPIRAALAALRALQSARAHPAAPPAGRR